MGNKKIIKTGFIVAASTVLVLIIIGLAYLGYRHALFEEEIHKNSLTGSGIVVTVKKGMDSSAIANYLIERGAIKYKKEFVKEADSMGFGKGYVAGSYRLIPGISYEEIAKQLCRKSSAAIIRFTIPEGYEVRNIADRLSTLRLIDKNKFYDVLNNENFSYDFLKNLPKRNIRLEGYLYPATYEARADSGEKHIIDMMLKRFDSALTEKDKARAKELHMSIDDVITLASVIEREAANASESPLVSSVFHNRLEKGIKLQSCATVQYILKKRKRVLSLADTKINSPYNTYMYAGLPVGPIASPGRTSIKAALYPIKSDYYYFVCKNGKSIFSKTYAEHLAAKKGK